MILAILYIEVGLIKAVHSMNEPGRTQFTWFWIIVSVFFAALLVWDYLMYRGADSKKDSALSTSECATVRKIILFEASPVHGIGLLIGLVMLLASHLYDKIDLLMFLAFGLALVGLCWILITLLYPVRGFQTT